MENPSALPIKVFKAHALLPGMRVTGSGVPHGTIKAIQFDSPSRLAFIAFYEDLGIRDWNVAFDTDVEVLWEPYDGD